MCETTETNFEHNTKARSPIDVTDFGISILKRLFPDEDFSKVHLLGESGIEDPWYTGNFEGVYDQIYSSIVHFLSEN